MTFTWFCIGLAFGGALGAVFGWGLGCRSATKVFNADRAAAAKGAEQSREYMLSANGIAFEIKDNVRHLPIDSFSLDDFQIAQDPAAIAQHTKA